MNCEERSMPVKFPPMRAQLELQRVHDLLNFALSEPLVRRILPDELLRPLTMAADCLCWALHHDASTDGHRCEHASNFGDLIFWLQHDLAEMGVGQDDRPEEEYIIEED